MEPYSSNTSREGPEDSQDNRLRSSPQVGHIDPPFTVVTTVSESGQISFTSFSGPSHFPALGLYHSLSRQAQSSASQAQISASTFGAAAPRSDQYLRHPRSYSSDSSLAPHGSPLQAPGFQTWDYSVSDQEQPSTTIPPLDRRLDHIESLAKAQYGPREQQSLQTGMSIMTPQYFSGIETNLSRSSHTWPVLEQSQPYVEDSQYLESFNEQQLLRRPQSTSSAPPRMLSMSLPTQRESRQLHQVRRDSKTRFRRERSHSNSYNPSLSTTPEAIPRTLPVDSYSAGQSSSSLAQARMSIPTFSSSLQVSDPQLADVYEQPYQLGMTDYSNNYLLPYSTATLDSSTPSLSSRPMPTSSMSSPDLGTYHRQPSASSLVNNQSQSTDASTDSVRVLLTRPKPQCWDHGCNGRAFSTFSNLLRHQREKNGVASKPTCPNCGAEFTRTTARNGHMAHEKCKKA